MGLLLFASYAIALLVALARAGHRSTTASPGGASRPRPSRLLIIGATGGTGRQLVTQALERGYQVTALVRSPSALPIVHPQLTVVQGNVLDERSVDAAMPGQDAVLSALGHKRYYSARRVLSDGTSHILRAMDAHGVHRFVCETSLGIGDSAGRLGVFYTFFLIPVVLPFYFWDKARQERLIAASSVDWVIVRPGVLTNGDRRNRVRHGLGIGSYLWTVRISRADVASFMLDQLTSDAYLRTTAGITG